MFLAFLVVSSVFNFLVLFVSFWLLSSLATIARRHWRRWRVGAADWFSLAHWLLYSFAGLAVAYSLISFIGWYVDCLPGLFYGY